ncbi:hypothetical protein KCG48_00770 [Proteiniclasticum sp. BAD-10]|uniref:DUF2680 domain-containing protein n=1 Tax=Proteiniclasticum sediminis TaxID=2804028 RepID=A0A941CP77_9CLOT|nr:hypothetical protein [Proteiniclasticum sediminis]MBR0574863.1 hypothetical protein [Proteiniclasticum sediminis]
MKTKRNLIAALALTLALGATTFTVFAAAQYDSPLEAAAGLTGKTTDELLEQRQESGKTLGQILDEAGKLDEFQAEILEQKKEILAERVAEGSLTQADADAILVRITENQALCDGTGLGMGGFGFGQGNGSGFGQGNGGGFGQGMMNGRGRGMMNGFGSGRR